MTHKKMAYISGMVVFLASVIFFGGILVLSAQNILFSDKYTVYVQFPDVVGLRDRSPVYMRGYRIGWTKDVFFERDRVRVRVDIKKKFSIPVDSTIEITTLNLIGEKAISITPGISAVYVEPRGILSGENKDIMILARDLLLEIKHKVRAGELEDQIKLAAGAVESFRALLQRLANTVKKVDMDLYNRQVKEIGQAGKQVQEFLLAAREDTRKFSRESSKTFEKLNHSLDRLNQVSLEIKSIAQKINRGQGTAGELLHNKQLMEEINRTLSSLQEFLADIKKHPKKYVRFSIF